MSTEVDRKYDDMWLSRNFREPEFWCPCCGLYRPSTRLILALEKLRRMAGNSPVTITSGTRCVRYNEAVGGVKYSKHLTGEAADVVVRGLHPEEVAILVEEITPFRNGGVGIYETFVHLDVRRDGRARWTG